MSRSQLGDLFEAIKLHIVTWWITAPLAVVAAFLYLPFKLLGKILNGNQEESKEAK